MKKRMLTMLLALVMIVSMLPLAAYAAIECNKSDNGLHHWEEYGSGNGKYRQCDDCDTKCGGNNNYSNPHDYGKYDQNPGGKCKKCGMTCPNASNHRSSRDCDTCGQKSNEHVHICDANGKCTITIYGSIKCTYQCPHTVCSSITGECRECPWVCAHEGTVGTNNVCTKCGMTVQTHDHKYSYADGTGECTVEEGCTVTCKHPASGGSAWDAQGKCKTCGVACTHDSWNTQGAEGVCQTCGLHCKHEAGFNNENRCNTCNKRCWHWNFGNNSSAFDEEGVCSSCHYACPHTNVNDDDICALCQKKIVTHEHRYDPIKGTGLCEEEGCDVPCKHPVKEGSSWDSLGKCKTCGKACDHDWKDGVCNTCKLTCNHKDSNGNSAWKQGKCDVCEIICKHNEYNKDDHKCKACGVACTHKGTNNQYTFTAGVCTKCDYTCEHNDNTTDDTCAKCGQQKHTHNFSSTDGKCTVSGCTATCSHTFSSTTGVCSECQMSCAHNWKDVKYQDGKEATCTKAGVMSVQCEHCRMMSAKDVDALDHEKEVLGVFVPATCTERGIHAYKCTREGCTFMWLDFVDELGHTKEIVNGKPATCTETGLTDGWKCSVCKETLQAQTVIDKLAHAWKPVDAKEPTCNEDGYNAHQMCEKCQETEGKVVAPSHGTEHDYVNFKCKYCKSYDPNHEHEGEITSTTPASCTAAGSNAFKCKNCDYEWTEKIKKLKHNYVNEKCTACELINPDHEHRYTQIGYTAPTCTADGKLNQRCDICDRHEENKINKLGHTYAGGLCSRCGAVAECSHSSKTTTIETRETCANTGLKKHTCDNCGKVTTETIPATGNHHYVNYRCTGCGKAEPNKITNDSQKIHLVG